MAASGAAALAAHSMVNMFGFDRAQAALLWSAGGNVFRVPLCPVLTSHYFTLEVVTYMSSTHQLRMKRTQELQVRAVVAGRTRKQDYEKTQNLNK